MIGAARRVDALELELWIPDPDPGELADRHPDVRVRRQHGSDLGERLAGAFEAVFGEGPDRAVVVGSDHPTLPAGLIETAFSRLDEAPAVLGPTPDGGYWGLGLRSTAWPEARRLFEDVPWSSGAVLATTRERARSAGISVAELPCWYDVDRPEDLGRLREDLTPGTATARALGRLDAREG